MIDYFVEKSISKQNNLCLKLSHKNTEIKIIGAYVSIEDTKEEKQINEKENND